MPEAEPLYDVAVVGFGPSGAVAAGLLGQAGLRTYVCDRAQGVYDKPRAIALDHEIMRVFQQLGVVEAVAPHTEPFTPSEYFGVDGQLIRRMTMVAPPYPLGYTPSLVFSQPPVEQVLREHVAALDEVTIELGVELIALAQDPDAVTLQLRDLQGKKRSIRARHVIGCDGASSTVRSLLGLPLEDLDFDEPWLVVDVRVNEAGLARLPATSVQYCEPDRPSSFIIGPGRHRRWEISLHADEDPREAATPEATWKLLSRWIGPADGELWRQASYRFHALVASRWRAGRVFVAGDAAHQQPPFLGQGMCQGIRDVGNLCWKIVAAQRGGLDGAACEALLDSYGDERKDHVRALTATIKGIGAVICERDVARARARDAQLLEACASQVRDTPRQDVLPRLAAGCLSRAAHSARGTLFPQPRVSAPDGRTGLMDALAGCGWRLVLERELEAAAHGLPHWHPTLGVLRLSAGAWQEHDGVVRAWMERHGCHAALVRPDHYVFGAAADAKELAELLRDWQGWLARGEAVTTD
ncbi:MAG TPA: bifunctional 3-(3-hydroxy-phenyl)propionate/3-hydroxycinnamic acid hydroxylase [Variovorax sp.]